MPSSPNRAPDRALLIADFLDRHGWATAEVQPFAADFSPRRYARLRRESGQTAILMDADADQKTEAFVAIDRLLRATRLRAPEIFAEDSNQGLVLMEDFGTKQIGTLLDAGEAPRPYFLRAGEFLAHLHRHFDLASARDKALPRFTSQLFTAQAALFLDTYMPLVLGTEATDAQKQDFAEAWGIVLRPLDSLPQSLLLRDFIADNLMDLPERQIGALDFQDAGIGPIAYDLASLCEEVRRDGGFALLPDVVAHYREAAQSPLSQNDLMRACTVLSAQRHTRILGIVARVAIGQGRRDKLDFLPRIRHHLDTILDQPYLRPVQAWMKEAGVFAATNGKEP